MGLAGCNAACTFIITAMGQIVGMASRGPVEPYCRLALCQARFSANQGGTLQLACTCLACKLACKHAACLSPTWLSVLPVSLQDSDKVDLREYHYDLIKFKSLGERHHDLMLKHFVDVMDELQNVLPAETRTQAIAAMKATRSHYRPMRPGE